MPALPDLSVPPRTPLGFGRVEPVHDAIVAARLAALRGAPHGALDDRPSPPGRGRGELPRGPRRSIARAIRSGIGHALITFGAFVQGPCDCPEGASPTTA